MGRRRKRERERERDSRGGLHFFYHEACLIDDWVTCSLVVVVVVVVVARETFDAVLLLV